MTLDGITPPVWRQLVVPDNLTFVQLHRVIQAAFGWEDCHLHQFEIGDQNIGMLDPDGFDPTEAVEDERAVRLADALDGRRTFRYWYDFGDDWWHDIVVEERVPDDGTSARLLAGARACPPEDCGGPFGYVELCETLADP
ncbi:MAG: plasmid pRiA4b ORF-3 family protein, partial [Betaproteobacteria bacterium]|nr:plasmid pRiA4b ORF-3 family protein [Betaproteobacteria bacterium]